MERVAVCQQLELLGGCIVVVVLRVWKRAGGGLGGWKPLEVGSDVRLGVGFLGHVCSASFYEWLSMC